MSVSCVKIRDEKKFLVYISLTLAYDRAVRLILCHFQLRLDLFVVCDLTMAVKKFSHRSLPPYALKRQILQ